MKISRKISSLLKQAAERNYYVYLAVSRFLEIPARNFLTVLPDDVFLASYARTGSTWVRFILGTLLHKKTTWENMEEFIPDIYRVSDQQLLMVPQPRIIKTHHCFDPRYNKVIYMVRDIRDVLLSYFSFTKKYGRKDVEIDQIISQICSKGVRDFGTWDENVRSWHNNRNRIKGGYMLIKYEDLKADTLGSIKQILVFIGQERPDQQIKEAIEWASFSNMRKMEESQKDTASLFKDSDKSVRYMRSGEAKGWKTALSADQIAILNKRFGDTLAQLGYEV